MSFSARPLKYLEYIQENNLDVNMLATIQATNQGIKKIILNNGEQIDIPSEYWIEQDIIQDSPEVYD